MIIDFRLRPPYKSFAEMGIFQIGTSTGNKYRDHAGNKGRRPIPSQEQRSMDLCMAEMDEAGITKAVIMGRQCLTGKAYAAGNADNNDTYELMNKYPGRFEGFAGVDPHSPDCLKEIERCVKGMGFKGVSMDPDGFTPALHADNPVFEPVYEKCRELGAIVSITLSAKFGPDMSYADPTPLQRVAKKYPDVEFVVPHAGYPHVPQVVGLAMQCLNIHLIPDFYIYFDSPKMPMSDIYIEAANSFLTYRTLFASSYPSRGFAQCLEGWRKRDWTEEALQCSLYDNAARLLKLV